MLFRSESIQNDRLPQGVGFLWTTLESYPGAKLEKLKERGGGPALPLNPAATPSGAKPPGMREV